MKGLGDFLDGVSGQSSFPCQLGESGGYINFRNSGKRGGVKEFTISLVSILNGLKDIASNLEAFNAISSYVESEWRDAGNKFFSDLALQSTITVQTKPCFTTFSKIVAWANDLDTYSDNEILITPESIANAINKVESLINYYRPKNISSKVIVNPKELRSSAIKLPKPFLLLAGISGTGKSRFVRQQAERNPAAKQLIISVRPDWHEPSDLLGYVSRLSAEGEQYIVTDALRFIFSAWQVAADFVEFSGAEINGARDDLANIPPFWLGLDEMNLAPVEQYFADYLSVIESRKWEWATDDTFTYSCEPLLSAEHCALIKDEKLRDAITPELWAYFEQYGMPIPFNLIVAGTVNMDETTHGFSRKVIDRALTVDYGEFAPNIFDDYFGSEVEPRVFSYPILSSVRIGDLEGTCDAGGKRSIEFLKAINEVLKDTPFELAYRALNELLISVACEKPQTHEELQAVWDDFLMTKVLPRIEGDADKLDKVFAKEKVEGKSEEPKLLKVVKEQLNITERKDLFLQARGGGDKALIPLRSPAKIEKMVERLESAGFTSFWP